MTNLASTLNISIVTISLSFAWKRIRVWILEDVLATSRKTISTFIVIILAEDVAEADDEDHQRNEAGLEAHVGGLLDTKIIIILSHSLEKCQMISFILRFFYNSQSLRMYPTRWVRHFFGQILMLVNCLSNYCYILLINDDEILIKDSQFCKMLKYIWFLL